MVKQRITLIKLTQYFKHEFKTCIWYRYKVKAYKKNKDS